MSVKSCMYSCTFVFHFHSRFKPYPFHNGKLNWSDALISGQSFPSCQSWIVSTEFVWYRDWIGIVPKLSIPMSLMQSMLGGHCGSCVFPYAFAVFLRVEIGFSGLIWPMYWARLWFRQWMSHKVQWTTSLFGKMPLCGTKEWNWVFAPLQNQVSLVGLDFWP